MGHPELSQGRQRWYVIAQEGDSVARVLSGMRLGETASGGLSFDASCAQLELDIADDGDLLVSAVREHELESAEGTRHGRQRLPRDSLAEIRLPHHVLKLTSSLTTAKQNQEVTQVLAVRSTANSARGQKDQSSDKTALTRSDSASQQPFRGSSRRMLPDPVAPADVPAAEPKPTPPVPASTQTPTPKPKRAKIRNPAPEPAQTRSPAPEPNQTRTPAPEPKQTRTPTPEPKQTRTPTPEPKQTRTPTPEPEQTRTPTPTPAPRRAQRTEQVERVKPLERMVRKVATNPVADADRRRYLMMSAAVLIGLAGIGFMLLTSTPPEAPGPESATTDAISPGPDTDSQPPAVESPPPAIEPIVVELSESAPDPVGMEIFEPVPDPDPLAMEPVEPAPDPVAVDPTGPSAATDPVERSESPPDPTVAEAFETAPDPVAADVIEPAPDPAVVEIFEPAPESVAVGELEPAPDPAAVEIFEPVPDPVVQPPTERASTPPLAPTAGVAVAGTGEQTIDSLPNMTVAAELEQFRETTEALEAELASRDLFAAELALELGRLVEPPQESAYTLYNRVLARYPDSPEAKAGLQAVGQKLINRTLAQLAGNELDSARSSLQAAEDAGVNPQLIADLRGEIEYRQQLTGE